MVFDVGVALRGLPHDSLTAIAGSTIWSKFLPDFALPRHLRGLGPRTRA